MDKGLIIDPIDDLPINCYPDADFAGLWGHEHRSLMRDSWRCEVCCCGA
ncbi:hypothetical protein ACHAWF_018828 [Thalassiosira exigua]